MARSRHMGAVALSRRMSQRRRISKYFLCRPYFESLSVFPPRVLTSVTSSPCHVWPASAWLCARAAAGRLRTDITCWLWTSSGTCAASSVASANWTWSPSSPASAKTAASTAKRTTTGRRARRCVFRAQPWHWRISVQQLSVKGG